MRVTMHAKGKVRSRISRMHVHNLVVSERSSTHFLLGVGLGVLSQYQHAHCFVHGAAAASSVVL